MISTVAVGTDGSDTAAQAVRTAVELARAFDASLVLLSACRDSRAAAEPVGDASERQWEFSQVARMREALSRIEEDAQRQGVDCTSMIDEGDPATVLVALAEECGADLLVIGSKGMHRRLLGSVPNAVTHSATCSVVVVKTT